MVGGSAAFALRMLRDTILGFGELGLSRMLEDLSRRQHGGNMSHKKGIVRNIANH
jgi:hypothetical protein